MLTKTLVYYFYIPEDYETNIALKMHIECLKRYCNIFDKAIFYISCNESEKKYVDEVKDFLFMLKDWPDIKIKIVENDMFCEARTFKAEILDNLDTFNEEIVFFGHTKGTTNVINYPDRVENTLKWIYGCYFYSLEYADEAVKELISGYRAFYGSFLMEDEKSDGAFYAGTFYWMNPASFKMVNKNAEQYNKLSNRFLAEYYPSYFFFNHGDGFLMSHFNRYLYNTNLYQRNLDDLIDFLGESESYYRNYNEIIEKIR